MAGPRGVPGRGRESARPRHTVEKFQNFKEQILQSSSERMPISRSFRFLQQDTECRTVKWHFMPLRENACKHVFKSSSFTCEDLIFPGIQSSGRLQKYYSGHNLGRVAEYWGMNPGGVASGEGGQDGLITGRALHWAHYSTTPGPEEQAAVERCTEVYTEDYKYMCTR